MEHVIRRFLILLSFLVLYLGADAQNSLPLHDALIEISKQHRLSLIFNPEQVENTSVSFPDTSWSVDKQLSTILNKSNLQYKIEDGQILIYIKRKIYGYLEDAETGERLISATILSVNNGTYDIANESGYFTLSTIEDSLEIEVSYVGYSTLKRTIYAKEMNRPITLGLSYDNNLEQVEISDALASYDERKYIELNKGSDILLYQNQASSAVGGEPDIFQAMIRQSGVNSGPDGVGGIHIRGGRNDQNQILYDGVRLYNSSHAFGVYSIINSNIIDQARLHKSGASGQFSGRLSSIMDVRIKDPNLNSINGNIQLSTIASQASLEVPIIKDKLGVMLTGRRTHIDPFIQSISRENKKDNAQDGQSNFYFDDMSLKLHGKISKSQRLYLSLYRATDQFSDQFAEQLSFGGELIYDYEERSQINWSNQLAALRYNLLLGSNTIVDFHMSAYEYEFENDYKDDFVEYLDYYNYPIYNGHIAEFDAGIRTIDMRLDFQTHTENHEIKYGVKAGRKNYQGGLLREYDMDEIDETMPLVNVPLLEYDLGNFDATEATLYLSHKYRSTDAVLLESGLYATHFQSVDNLDTDTGSSYTNMFGYLKGLFKIAEGMHFGVSAGTFVQNEHLLSIGDNGYPSDVWLPSTKGTPPQRSYQAEVFGDIKYGSHTLKASAYYKEQKGLVVFSEPSLPSISNTETDFWEEDTFLADAKGYGIELDYTFSIRDKFTFRSIYTATHADYFYLDQFGQEDSYPFDYSIPHTVNIAMNAKLTNRFRLSIDWYFAAGRPYTLFSVDKSFSPIERIEAGAVVFQISDIDNDRTLPSAHKLSIALSTSWHWGKVKNDLTLGVQNVYNRNNFLYKYEFDDGYERETRGQGSFPILPLLRWRVEF